MATTKKANTAVTETKKTSVATVSKAPGRGFEEADKDAFSIPFIYILQDQSKALDTVKGSKAGMFFNSATNRLYPELMVVPVLYRRRFVEWGPDRGGFKGEHTASQVAALEQAGKVSQNHDDEDDRTLYRALPDGKVNKKKCNAIQDTRSIFVLVDGKPAILAFTSTQIKKSKNWMNLMSEAGGDMFDHKYSITTVKESNDQGKWFGFNIEPSNMRVTEQERATAEALYNSVASGAAKADYESARDQ